MKNRALLILASAVVILSIMACSLGDLLPGGATEPVVTNPPVDNPDNPPPAGALEILSTSSFMDSYSGFYVFGEVANNSDSPITSIELSISITDASGASLLKDDNGNPTDTNTFYTMLWTLDANESSPFSYYFDTTDGIPANYEVSISSYDAGTANRGQLQSENVQIVEDGSGYYVLTGELVNMSDQWVHIWGLTGGVLDDANTVLSADWTGTFTTLLAPNGEGSDRNRTPFYVSFPVPMTEATQWSLWWDADIETDVTDYALGVEVTNSYFDEYGSAHLVGVVENNADTALNSLVVAGLYAEDGTVLDASYSFLPVPILPGVQVPFDVSYFGSVNYSEEQAALVSRYTVQFDPWSTYPPLYENVGLAAAGETIQKDGSTWTVAGNFTNTTDKNLSGVTVMVAVYDSTNALVAMGYTYAFPSGDSFAPGAGDAYEIFIYLEPGIDTTGFTTQTFVVGDVSE